MKTIFTFLTLSLYGQLFAQFINTQQQQSVYYSRQNSYGNESNLRYAAEDISNDNHNNSPAIGFNYTERLRVYQSGQNAVEARFMIDNIQVQNVQYKNFDFTQLFMPTAVEIQGELWRNGRRLQTYNSQQQYVNGRQAGEFIMRYQDTMQSTNYEFRLSRVSLEFNSNMRDKVKKRAEAVDEYSKSISKNQSWTNQLYSINTQNADVDSLETYEERLKKVEKEFNEWKNARFWDELDVSQSNRYDPMRVEELRDNTQQQLRDKKAQFERLDVPYLYAQKSNEWFNRQNYTKAESYANKALYKKTNYSLAKLMMAKIYVVEEKWDKAADYYEDACDNKRDMQDKFSWETDLTNTGNNILNHLQQQAQRFLNGKEWEKAAKYGKEWKRFCEKGRDCINCNSNNIDNFFEQLSQRWQEHYLQLAQRHQQSTNSYLQNKNWSEAQKSLKLATECLSDCKEVATNYRYAINTQAENEQNARLKYKLYHEWANADFQDGNFNSALERAKIAKSTANSYGFLSDKINEANLLEYKVQNAIFDQIVSFSKREEANNSFKSALIAATKAQNLDAEFGFLNDIEKKDLADRIQNLGSQYVAKEVDNSLNNNDISEKALLVLWQELQTQQIKFGLKNPDIGNNLERLRQHTCQKVQSNKLDKNAENIRQAIQSKNFISAKVFLDSIKKYSGDFAPFNCNFDNQFAASVADEIEICEQYQQAYQSAESLEKQGLYDAAITKYVEANSIYKNAWVQKNFINPQYDLANYIIGKNDKAFVVSGCLYYENQQDADNAFSLLQVWIKLENPKELKKTQDSQAVIGKLIANKYYNEDKKWQQGLNEVLKENSKSKQWKVFKRAFKRAWRAKK